MYVALESLSGRQSTIRLKRAGTDSSASTQTKLPQRCWCHHCTPTDTDFVSSKVLAWASRPVFYGFDKEKTFFLIAFSIAIVFRSFASRRWSSHTIGKTWSSCTACTGIAKSAPPITQPIGTDSRKFCSVPDAFSDVKYFFLLSLLSSRNRIDVANKIGKYMWVGVCAGKELPSRRAGGNRVKNSATALNP